MFRFLIALALVRVLVQATGLDLIPDACVDTPFEECDDCPCCPHQRPVIVQVRVEAPVPEVERSEFAVVVRAVLEPSPREIVHVPKRRFSV